MSLRPAAWPICIAAVLLVAACGSGPDDTADDPLTSRSAAVSARVDQPGSAVTEGGAAVCDDRQKPAGRDYAVSEVPADDPDGGLVLLDGAGEGTVQVAILPGGAPVRPIDDPAACAVLADGGVWWEVRSADGVQGWVDSRSLTRRG